MSCRKPQGIIDSSVTAAMQTNHGKFLFGEILQLPSLHLTFYYVATIQPGILEVDTRDHSFLDGCHACALSDQPIKFSN